jgi:bisphosphoglycerate-independent phosphoglycerate mutase (AlkP superfamily)
MATRLKPSTNPVSLVHICVQKTSLHAETLIDLTPTTLAILGKQQSVQMTGRLLI